MRILSLICLLMLVACASVPPKTGDVPIGNFHMFESRMYRGAQPDAGGIAYLKKIGVKTIIDLNNDDDTMKVEREQATAAGLYYVYFPMSGFWGPKESYVEKILRVMNDPNQLPIYIHCKYGEDRTSLIVGLYRVRTDKWTRDDAYNEMRQYGFHPLLIPLKNFFWDN